MKLAAFLNRIKQHIIDQKKSVEKGVAMFNLRMHESISPIDDMIHSIKVVDQQAFSKAYEKLFEILEDSRLVADLEEEWSDFEKYSAFFSRDYDANHWWGLRNENSIAAEASQLQP